MEPVDETLLDHRFIVVENPDRLPPGLSNPVVAIGNFDGVHRGHQAVIARAKALAARLGRPCAVLSFEPHPANYFAGRPVIFRLTTEEAKAMALARLGVNGLIVLTFDRGLAECEPADFVANILLKLLGIAAAVVGYDFHFGRNRAGTPAFLQAEGERLGFAVDIVKRIEADAAGDLTAVSSTAIRLALEAGDVRRARLLLGRPYFVTGEVVHGQKLGRTLGFPTSNLRLDPSSRLSHGIYAVRVKGEGLDHGGVASFGRRPTFDNGALLLEVFLFDFDGDLYGQTVEVDFIEWIRSEQKFDSVGALVARMKVDAAEARRALVGDAGVVSLAR